MMMPHPTTHMMMQNALSTSLDVEAYRVAAVDLARNAQSAAAAQTQTGGSHSGTSVLNRAGALAALQAGSKKPYHGSLAGSLKPPAVTATKC